MLAEDIEYVLTEVYARLAWKSKALKPHTKKKKNKKTLGLVNWSE